MSGAWEREGPSVLMAILTREIVSMKWAMGFRNIALPSGSGISVRAGAPFDVARNTACEDALTHGFQWVFFLDDDVVPPPDVFLQLARHNLDVVSGLYYRRHEPVCPVAMTIGPDGQSRWVTSWNPPNCLLEVDLVGAGCLLIHRRVLERTPRPWFDWEIGRESTAPAEAAPADGAQKRSKMSEDFAFCVRAKRAGFKIHLDTAIRCEHIGLGHATSDGNFRPSALP